MSTEELRDAIAATLHDLAERRFSVQQVGIDWRSCLDSDDHREEADAIVALLVREAVAP